MLSRFTRLRKGFMLIATGLTFLTLSRSMFPYGNASTTKYMYLTARGESMYPAICDGDVTKVEMCNDGDAIDVGDIIVYCTIAALSFVPNPTSMWIGHRVVEKYQVEGKWIFITKGDNIPEPDPWKVPQSSLLGIVVEVEHTDTPLRESLHTESSTNSQVQFFTVSNELLCVGGCFLAGTVAVFIKLRRRRSRQLAI